MSKLQVRGAAKIMDSFCKQGLYTEMKRLEKRIEFIKNLIRSHQEKLDIKRQNYNGVLGKFVAYNVYETDYAGLNEYLNNLGILVHLSKLDSTRLKACEGDYHVANLFSISGTPYVRFNPNKAARVQEEDLTYLSEDPYRLIADWRVATGLLSSIEKLYEAAKEGMLRSRILKKERKLSLNYGSISLVDAKPSYDIESIYNNLGDSFLIRYAKPDMVQLDDYIAMGFLKKKELDQFRKIVDVQLRFVLMEQETEDRMFDYFHKRIQRLLKKSSQVKPHYGNIENAHE